MTHIEIVSKPYQFANMLRELQTTKFLGVDTETTGLDVHFYHPLLISLYDGKTAYVIDLLSLGKDYTKQLKPILESRDILKIGHNLTFEYKFFMKFGIDMQHMHDIMICDRMIYAGLRMRHTLKDVVFRRLNIDMDKTIRKSFIDANIEDISWSKEQLEYSAMDAVYPVLMYPMQMTDIAERKLERTYELEMNIIAPTGCMEYTGINVNRSMLEAMVEPFEHFVRLADKALQDMFIANGAAESIIFTRAGYSTINTASSDQVLQALQKLGIEVTDNKGKPSLGAKIVQRWDMLQRKKRGKKLYKDWQIDYHELIEDTEVADALDAYIGLDNPFLRAFTFLQGARKLLSTYVYGMINAINPITNRIHPHFNSYGAEATGRYSSNDINFQNLPNDKKLKVLGLGSYSLRKTIEATKGRKLIIADYSGIELVILAANSGDKKLMEMILKGDVHTEVTIIVLGYKDITPQNKKKDPHKLWRDAAKTLSYGIAYGTTGRNIAETLNIMLASVGYKIDASQGDELIAKWFALFPDVHAYLMKNAEKAVRDGFVVDAWGRRRNWDRETFVDKWKRLAAMREGMNMPIQGSSASMTKRAIWLLWERLDRRKARIIITVHDEIVVESIESYTEIAVQIIKDSMEDAIRETLPIIADDVGLYEGTSVSPNISDRYDK